MLLTTNGKPFIPDTIYCVMLSPEKIDDHDLTESFIPGVYVVGMPKEVVESEIKI